VPNANPAFHFRNDTVGENDHLSYKGVERGNGTFGLDEKWDNTDKVFRRILLAVILLVLALAVGVFLVLRRRDFKRMMRIAQEAADKPETVFENVQLSAREEEIGKLLLTELSMKQIATVMHIAYPTVYFHAGKLYRKMGIESRMELLRMRNEKEMRNEQ
jgi:DNA-binding CsgD family transcriptional regulator